MELYLREKDGDVKKNVRLFKNKSYSELSEAIRGCNTGDEIIIYTDMLPFKKEFISYAWYLLYTKSVENKEIYHLFYVDDKSNLNLLFKSNTLEIIKLLYKNVYSGVKIKYLKELDKRTYQIVKNNSEKVSVKKYKGLYYKSVEKKSFTLFTAIKYAEKLANDDRGNTYSVLTRGGKIVFEIIKHK